MSESVKVATMPETGKTTNDPNDVASHGMPRWLWLVIALFVIGIVAMIVHGIVSRAAEERELEKETRQSAIPIVQVTHPTLAKLSDEISLPGNTQAFTDTPIFARTSGYLKKWYFDIGARVKKGQLMAEIETPELDQQLLVARADLKSAQANLNLANTTAERYQNLLKTNSVSKQETDVAVSDAAAKLAAEEASRANVRRLEQLQGFEQVYAPFDGIVTARRIDIGSLIAAGQNSTPQELFHMAATGTMRVFVSVPEAYTSAIHEGGEATLTLDEYPGQLFTGHIARNSNAIDQLTRTLTVEVDIDNPKGQLLPGAYVFVHFKTATHAETLTLPSNTLLFRKEGLQVGVVRDGKVALIPIKITHDGGAIVEVSGLQPTDNVILDPSDSLSTGQIVHIAEQPRTTGAQ